MNIRIAHDGYLYHKDKRLIAFGANYWPGSCGVNMWLDWPEHEIQLDLDLAKKLGMNTVRFFLRWPDFEPESGSYDRKMCDQLVQLLGWYKERDLFAIPTLFVGFMSGGFFWPSWKQDKNLFNHPFMIEACAAYAKAMCREMEPYAGSIMAIDLGNELTAVQDSPDAGPAACGKWNQAMSHAIKSVLPDTLVMNGHDHNQVVFDRGWRFDNQNGCDLLSMHSYPVPAWQPIIFDGMTDPLASEMLPYYTKCARAFGPVMVQEFGTIVTRGEEQQRTYLQRMLPQLWEAGANGFLWWCLKDIPALIHPYLKGRKESALGIVDVQGNVKPGLEPLIDFGQSLQAKPAPVWTASDRSRYTSEVGLYWCKHYYPIDDPENPGNHCGTNAAAMLVANHALRKLGHEVCVIRAGEPISSELKYLIVNGQSLDTAELISLHEWVKSGGKLVWHGMRPMEAGPEFEELFGVKMVDYRAATETTIPSFADQDWKFETFAGKHQMELALIDAEVIRVDTEGLIVISRKSHCDGVAVLVTPMVDRDFARQSCQRINTRDSWMNWYRALLKLLDRGNTESA